MLAAEFRGAGSGCLVHFFSCFLHLWIISWRFPAYTWEAYTIAFLHLDPRLRGWDV
jgi:hypothetical protein